MENSNSTSNASWRLKVHEVKFSPAEIVKLRELDEKQNSNLHDVLEALVVDNCGLKVRSTEFYGSYTFSYTIDKAHPTHPGHSWWFYDTDLGRGIRVMGIFVEMYLGDVIAGGVEKQQAGLW